MGNRGKILNVKRVYLKEVDLNTYFKSKFITTYEKYIKSE